MSTFTYTYHWVNDGKYHAYGSGGDLAAALRAAESAAQRSEHRLKWDERFQRTWTIRQVECTEGHIDICFKAIVEIEYPDPGEPRVIETVLGYPPTDYTTTGEPIYAIKGSTIYIDCPDCVYAPMLRVAKMGNRWNRSNCPSCGHTGLARIELISSPQHHDDGCTLGAECDDTTHEIGWLVMGVLRP